DDEVALIAVPLLGPLAVLELLLPEQLAALAHPGLGVGLLFGLGLFVLRFGQEDGGEGENEEKCAHAHPLQRIPGTNRQTYPITSKWAGSIQKAAGLQLLGDVIGVGRHYHEQRQVSAAVVLDGVLDAGGGVDDVLLADFAELAVDLEVAAALDHVV